MTDAASLDPQELAFKVRDALFARDHAAQALGISVDKISPGTATLSMKVSKDMVNGHDICHGGMIFSLADTAFAYACNSRNISTVASGCSIEFLAPARLGDRLSAEAIEINLGKRTGVYDIKVINQELRLIAVMRGKSASLRRPVIEENEEV